VEVVFTTKSFVQFVILELVLTDHTHIALLFLALLILPLEQRHGFDVLLLEELLLFVGLVFVETPPEDRTNVVYAVSCASNGLHKVCILPQHVALLVVQIDFLLELHAEDEGQQRTE